MTPRATTKEKRIQSEDVFLGLVASSDARRCLRAGCPVLRMPSLFTPGLEAKKREDSISVTYCGKQISALKLKYVYKQVTQIPQGLRDQRPAKSDQLMTIQEVDQTTMIHSEASHETGSNQQTVADIQIPQCGGYKPSERLKDHRPRGTRSTNDR
uniref:TMV resistance protein N-like n=1 Tax=Steinernema glaseri TaxID=37863 RepID=A0A1I8AUI6_9BILA